MHIVGNLNRDAVTENLSDLGQAWNGTAQEIPQFDTPSAPEKGKLYFIDVPGSKQSVLYIGKPALAVTEPDSDELDFTNEILGGGSSGRLFQTLRIEKGYTYGVYSSILDRKAVAPFVIYGSVRANATLASLEIIEKMVQDYGPGFGEEEVTLTRNKVLKANTRSFESLGAKLNILGNISKYDKPKNYLEQEQHRLMEMELKDFKGIIDRYLDESQMIYVVVGDKKTQFAEVKMLGKEVIELDIYGNPIN